MSKATIMLAIETSQRRGGVAVSAPDGSVHVEALRQADRHDDDLMPGIDRLMRRAQLKPRDLQAVAVSIGPGGFTGLRIAVSTAKMFAESLGARIIAVPSAQVAAMSQDSPGPIGVALACKATSFWLTRLTRDDTWRIDGQPGLTEAESFDLNGLQLLLADAYFPEQARRRCELAGVRVADPVFTPEACLALGQILLARGESTDALRLAPLYPREPEAATLWARRQAAGERPAVQ